MSRGRPTIVARVTDAKSGVDPLSLQLFFGRQLENAVSATTFDPATGIATFSYPREETALLPGTAFMRIVASDFQEAKNIDTESDEPDAEHSLPGCPHRGREPPDGYMDHPAQGRCLAAKQRLQVVANDNVQISSVGFFDGNRQIGRVRKNVAGLYELIWRTSGKKKGTHVLTAVASDVRGREAEASQSVRIC